MKKWIILIASAGLAVLLLVPWLFFRIGHVSLRASQSSSDWGNFGSYFGGVSGPILTFISILLIIITIALQHVEIIDFKQEAIKQDMLRYLDKLDNDIARLLSSRIMLDGNDHYAELGHMVYGIQNVSYWSRDSFVAALEKLTRLTSHYSESIALYRNNVNSYFVFRAHRDKAKELLDFLDKHTDLLSASAQMALAFSRKHLESSQGD